MILRYPGGKELLAPKILSKAPAHYLEYREPFVGGGHVFFAVDPDKKRWVNDLDTDLIAVYRALRGQPEQFIKALRAIPTADEDPARLEETFWRFAEDKSVDPAVRYYLLNRTSWGALPSRIHRGGLFFSKPEGWKMTRGDRLWRAAGVLRGVTVTAGDYLPLLLAPGDGVWVYCDPPFVVGAEALYHHAFTAAQHIALAGHVRACPHQVLLSYDDTPFIRDLYSGFNIFTEDVRYRLRTGHRVRAKELLITNY